MTVTLGVRTIVQRESARTGAAMAQTTAHAQTIRPTRQATRSMKHLAGRCSFSPIRQSARQRLLEEGDEARPRESRIRVAVEALATRHSKAPLLDEVLVEVARVLARLAAWAALANQLCDVVHDAETHAIHHAARTDAALQRDHP